MREWAEGFERVNPHGGGSWLPLGTGPGQARWKWCGHTTEGLSRNPAGAFAGHPYPPHCWVTLPSHPYAPARRLQRVPFSRSALALKHPRGTPETNKARPLQVEIEGFAAQAAGWSTEDLDWLADQVIRPMCEAVEDDFPFDVFLNVNPNVSTAYGPGAPQRLAPGREWYQFHGLAVHQHCPSNAHWDAPIDLAYISARLSQGDDDMPAYSDWSDADKAAFRSDIQAVVDDRLTHHLATLTDGHPTSVDDRAGTYGTRKLRDDLKLSMLAVGVNVINALKPTDAKAAVAQLEADVDKATAEP